MHLIYSSQKIEYMKNNYFIIILLVFLSYSCFSQQKALDSIASKIISISDSTAINTSTDLIYELSLKEKFNIALSYTDKFIKISKKIGYHKGTGRVYNEKAYVYNVTDKTSEAMHAYNQAAVYFEKASYNRGLAVVNNNKAIIQQKLGNYESSISYLLESGSYYEKLNDSISLSETYNNIGNVYKKLRDFDLAKKNYHKSILIKKKFNVKNLGSTLNNLALTYINLKQLDKASKLLEESLEVSKKVNDSRTIAGAYSALGQLYLTKKEYQQAKKHFESSLFLGGKIEYSQRLINTKLALGLIAIRTNDLKEAQKCISFARGESRKLSSVPLLLTSYKYSALLDSTRGKYLDAYQWQQKYQTLYSENTMVETSQKIELAEKRLKEEIAQQKIIEEQRLKEQKTKQQLSNHKTYTYISLVAFICIAIFLFYIIKSRNERKQYVKQLDESNQVKNKLFSIISHDLKNEVHGLEGSLNLLKENTISSEEFREIVPLLAYKTHQTSILLTNLLNWSKSQMKELKAKPIEFDITDVISSKFAFFTPRAELKDIQLISMLEPTMVYADKDMFAIVAQNLIANAIKFCNPGDSITLVSTEKEKHYEICFKDTGIGIAAENINKLFAEDTFTTNGTQHETGTGLGLKICKELIELNKGTISVHSTPGKGSTFCISLPKK